MRIYIIAYLMTCCGTVGSYTASDDASQAPVQDVEPQPSFYPGELCCQQAESSLSPWYGDADITAAGVTCGDDGVVVECIWSSGGSSVNSHQPSGKPQ
jgi:hypothetical protein